MSAATGFLDRVSKGFADQDQVENGRRYAQQHPDNFEGHFLFLLHHLEVGGWGAVLGYFLEMGQKEEDYTFLFNYLFLGVKKELSLEDEAVAFLVYATLTFHITSPANRPIGYHAA